MVKNLRLFLLSLVALFCGTVMAGSINFSELNLVNGVQYSDPFDGGDFTVTFSGGGNDGKYYETGKGIRVYGGGTMTIAAKNGTLKKIVITFDGSNKPSDGTVVDNGTYNASTGVWTGDAAQVVFTRPSGSGHWRVQKIDVGEDAQDPEVVTEGQTPETAITVDRALELINALEDNGKTSYSYYVKGTVSSITELSTQYGNATFVMAEKLTVFRAKGLENKEITNENLIKANDAVVVYGQLMKFVKDQVVTPEVAQGGYIYSVNGKTKDDTPEVDPNTKGQVNNPYTVEEAAEALKAGPVTGNVYVKGFITNIDELSTQYGNATFRIATNNDKDAELKLKAYRAKYLENNAFTAEDQIKVGDEVVLCGKLVVYGEGDKAEGQLTNGYIYSLNGKTKPEEKPVELVGDGSLNNPYTVADLKAMAIPTSTSATEGQEKVWVKGFIVNAFNSTGSVFDENVATNIALGATATEADAANCVPVQLPTGDIRSTLNVVDNANNKGKEVMVYGHILKYMSKTGVKNLSDFVFDNNQYTTGITEVNAQNRFQGTIYNLRGQRVSVAGKGLYIVNGKKVFVK